jgi:hypothetical protein
MANRGFSLPHNYTAPAKLQNVNVDVPWRSFCRLEQMLVQGYILYTHTGHRHHLSVANNEIHLLNEIYE